MKSPIQAVEVSYFVQATEDPEGLDRRIRVLLDIQGQGEVDSLEGHFGNKILHVRHHLIGSEAERVVEALATNLPAEVKGELDESMAKSIDEHSALYLRLDKQMLMTGRMGLGTSDPIRIKLKPRLFTVRGELQDFYRRVMRLHG